MKVQPYLGALGRTRTATTAASVARDHPLQLRMRRTTSGVNRAFSRQFLGALEPPAPDDGDRQAGPLGGTAAVES